MLRIFEIRALQNTEYGLGVAHSREFFGTYLPVSFLDFRSQNAQGLRQRYNFWRQPSQYLSLELSGCIGFKHPLSKRFDPFGQKVNRRRNCFFDLSGQTAPMTSAIANSISGDNPANASASNSVAAWVSSTRAVICAIRSLTVRISSVASPVTTILSLVASVLVLVSVVAVSVVAVLSSVALCGFFRCCGVGLYYLLLVSTTACEPCFAPQQFVRGNLAACKIVLPLVFSLRKIPALPTVFPYDSL